MSCRGVLAKRVIFGGPQIWPKMTQNDPKSTHFGSYLDPILRETLNKRGHFGTYFGSFWVIFGSYLDPSRGSILRETLNKSTHFGSYLTPWIRPTFGSLLSSKYDHFGPKWPLEQEWPFDLWI